MPSTPIPIDRLRDVVLGRDPAFARPQAFAELAASELPNREQLLATVTQAVSGSVREPSRAPRFTRVVGASG